MIKNKKIIMIKNLKINNKILYNWLLVSAKRIIPSWQERGKG